MEDLIKSFLELEDGSGDGYGYGYGDGDGLKSINGSAVYYIDGVPTVLKHIRGSVAKASIVQSDLTLQPCFVVKGTNCFAHGESLAKAFQALQEKMLELMPTEERVAAFVAEFKPGQSYPNMDFFRWHHLLTGSCEMGRRQFAKDHQIDLAGSMTPEAFVALTKDAYGAEVIRQLKPHYGVE